MSTHVVAWEMVVCSGKALEQINLAEEVPKCRVSLSGCGTEANKPGRG